MEWKIFDGTVEPIGDARRDWQAASVASAMMNGTERLIAVLTGRRRPRKTWSPADWLLKFGPQQQAKKEGEKAWQRMKRTAKMWATYLNAVEEKKSR